MSEKIHRLNGGACFCMSEKIYRINRRGLLLYVRCQRDIPIYRLNESLLLCGRGLNEGGLLLYVLYTDSMKGVCFCMSEKIYRLNERGLLLYVREDIPTPIKGSLLLYVREDIPTQ